MSSESNNWGALMVVGVVVALVLLWVVAITPSRRPVARPGGPVRVEQPDRRSVTIDCIALRSGSSAARVRATIADSPRGEAWMLEALAASYDCELP